MFTEQKLITYLLHTTNLKKQAKNIFLLMGATGNKERFSTGDKPLGGIFQNQNCWGVYVFQKVN